MPSPQTEILKQTMSLAHRFLFTDQTTHQTKRILMDAPFVPLRLLTGRKTREMAGVVVEEFGHPTADKICLYLHGGAFTFGSSDSHRPLLAALPGGDMADLKVLAPNYSLAPEHPFPVALNEVTSIYKSLLADGHPPGKIIIAGDSAGGNLTLATMLKLKEDQVALPAGAVCLSPSTDMTRSGKSIREREDRDPMLKRASLDHFTDLYITPDQLKNPLVSPLYGDLSDLPPILIQVGSEEVLFSDAEEFYKKAKAAGVKIELKIYDGQFHVFQLFHHILPEGRQALREIRRFIRDRVGY